MKLTQMIDNNGFTQTFSLPIHIFQYHKSSISCLTLLKDGRFASGSYDQSIIIYNNINFKPELTIKDHHNGISCLIQLSSGILASCSDVIKLYDIKGKECRVVQTLNFHIKYIFNLIELTNGKLVSCSIDSEIIFYFKDNNKYLQDYYFNPSGYAYLLIQTKENEILYSGYFNNKNYMCFYDLNERKVIKKIDNDIYIYNFMRISIDLLIIVGNNSNIMVMNIFTHNIIKTIENIGSIHSICLLCEKMLLTAGNYNIKQWKIEGDNLILVSVKEIAHNENIQVILNLDNMHIITGDSKGVIKVW